MRTTLTGKTFYGVRYDTQTPETENRVQSSVSPSLPTKRSTNGINGVSEKDKHEIIKSVYYLQSTYGYQRLLWLVLTFDEQLSDEGLTNLLTDFDKLKNKAVPRYLNKLYQSEESPWVAIYGLRERQSFARKLPCYDLNMVLLYLDESGKPLFDLDLLVKDIFMSASKLAKETIAARLNTYERRLDATKPALQLAHYLGNQVDCVQLKALANKLSPADRERYVLRQWATIPKPLKAATADLKSKLGEGKLGDVIEQLSRPSFAEQIAPTSVESQKITVELKPEAIAQGEAFHKAFERHWENNRPDGGS